MLEARLKNFLEDSTGLRGDKKHQAENSLSRNLTVEQLKNSVCALEERVPLPRADIFFNRSQETLLALSLFAW